MKPQQTQAKLLQEDEGEAVELYNPDGKAPIILICEHASKFIPKSLHGLGLTEEGLESHAAWDISAYDLACELSELIDAPLVAARVSRLVYDCNRSPESGRGTPSKSEIYDVPGNKNLSGAEYKQRVMEVYEPFHRMISQIINSQNSVIEKPAIITSDNRLAQPMMQMAQEFSDFKAEFNSPYGVSDDVMHTVNKHATEQQLLNVMIEVKNDLLRTSADIFSVATILSKIIIKSVAETKQSKKL